MKKLFALLSFIVTLSTHSALVFADDNDYYDANDGYRYSQPEAIIISKIIVIILSYKVNIISRSRKLINITDQRSPTITHHRARIGAITSTLPLSVSGKVFSRAL